MLRMVLHDNQWVRIEKLLQGEAGDWGRRGANNRFFVEAVLWVARIGSLGAVCTQRCDRI